MHYIPSIRLLTPAGMEKHTTCLVRYQVLLRSRMTQFTDAPMGSFHHAMTVILEIVSRLYLRQTRSFSDICMPHARAAVLFSRIRPQPCPVNAYTTEEYTVMWLVTAIVSTVGLILNVYMAATW